MKKLLSLVIGYIRKQLWAFIVAYMVGMHNFYHGDNKDRDTIRSKVEHIEEHENGSPE